MWLDEGGQPYPHVSSAKLWANVSGGESVTSVLILPDKSVQTFSLAEELPAYTSALLAAGIEPAGTAARGTQRVHSIIPNIMPMASGIRIVTGAAASVDIFRADGTRVGHRDVQSGTAHAFTGLSSGYYMVRVSSRGIIQSTGIVVGE